MRELNLSVRKFRSKPFRNVIDGGLFQMIDQIPSMVQIHWELLTLRQSVLKNYNGLKQLQKLLNLGIYYPLSSFVIFD